MLPAPSTLAAEYDHVLRAAASVGLSQPARQIARRASSLDQPFTLCVMGDRQSGKSTVINHLIGADVALERSDAEQWVNVYRKRRGRYSFAEVRWRTSGQKHEIMPLAQARSLLRGGPAFEANLSGDVERVVWHVDAEGLHRDLSVVEVPSAPESVTEACWEADAVLWVTRAEKTDTATSSPALGVMRREHAPFVPALCVVTHMDTLERGLWISRLRTLRNGYGLTFENVVPFALEQGVGGSVPSAMISPLRRAVHKWFISGADHTRRQNHEHFIKAMKRLVTRHLEREMDHLLRGATEYETFVAKLDASLAQAIHPVFEHLDHYVHLLADSFAAHGERLERDVTSSRVEPFIPPLQPDIFFDRLTADILDTIPALARSWATESGTGLPPADRRRTPPVRAPRLPAPPAEAFAAFQRTQQESLTVEAEVFDEAHPTLKGHVPTEAAVYEPARLAAGRRASAARKSGYAWLRTLIPVLRETAVHNTRAGFLERFGCTPERVPNRLAALEAHYGQLTGRDNTMPTPSAAFGQIKAAHFLWSARRPEFVADWNLAVLRRLLPDVISELGRMVKQELVTHHEAQQQAWTAARNRMEVEVTPEADGRLRRMVPGLNRRWSLTRALDLLHADQKRPTLSAANRGSINPAIQRLERLLLTHDDHFLHSARALRDGGAVQLVWQAMCATVQDEIDFIWNSPLDVVLMRDVGQVHAAIARMLEDRAERLLRYLDRLVREPAFAQELLRWLEDRIGSNTPTLPSYGELMRRLHRIAPIAVAA